MFAGVHHDALFSEAVLDDAVVVRVTTNNENIPRLSADPLRKLH